MEVGPLNPIDPLVPGAKEGRDARTERKGKPDPPVKNNQPVAVRSTDRVEIANRGNNLKEMQGRIGVSKSATKAILNLIKDLGSSVEKLNAEEVKAAAKKAASAEFNGKPVFNGKNLTHKSSNGRSNNLKLPGKDGLVNMVTTSFEDYLKGKKPEAEAFKALNKFTDDLGHFAETVKKDLKDVIGSTNKGASKSATKDLKAIRAAVKEAAANRPKGSKQPPGKQMASKAIKLLK